MADGETEVTEVGRPRWATIVGVLGATASIAAVLRGGSLLLLPGEYRIMALAMGLPVLVPSAVAAALFVSFARNGGGVKLFVAIVLLAAGVFAGWSLLR